MTEQVEYTDEVMDAFLKRSINVYVRRDKQMYEFDYDSNVQDQKDLVVEWKPVLEILKDLAKPPKKLFKVSLWKKRMQVLAAAPCIKKVAWR